MTLHSEGKNGVANVCGELHAQVDISNSIASIPGVHRVVVANWTAVNAAQGVVETVETVGVVVVIPVSKFYVVEVIVAVKLEHYIIPVIVHKLHVGQVNDVVLKSVNLITTVVQVVQ